MSSATNQSIAALFDTAVWIGQSIYRFAAILWPDSSQSQYRFSLNFKFGPYSHQRMLQEGSKQMQLRGLFVYSSVFVRHLAAFPLSLLSIAEEQQFIGSSLEWSCPIIEGFGLIIEAISINFSKCDTARKGLNLAPRDHKSEITNHTKIHLIEPQN